MRHNEPLARFLLPSLASCPRLAGTYSGLVFLDAKIFLSDILSITISITIIIAVVVSLLRVTTSPRFFSRERPPSPHLVFPGLALLLLVSLSNSRL